MVDAETNSLGYGAAVGSVFDVIDETQIREADRRLSGAAVPGGNVMLFGSHARGDAGDRSDQDILVIKAEVENAALEGGPLDARTTRPPAGRRGHRRQRKRCRGAGEEVAPCSVELGSVGPLMYSGVRECSGRLALHRRGTR
jgi:hypothetical protein